MGMRCVACTHLSCIYLALNGCASPAGEQKELEEVRRRREQFEGAASADTADAGVLLQQAQLDQVCSRGVLHAWPFQQGIY